MLRRGGRLVLAGAALFAAALLPACSGEAEASERPLVARFALVSQPYSLDPRHADISANAVLQRQVFEGLFEYDPHVDPPRVRPLLAEEPGNYNDGRDWIIVLRKNARFHDPETPPLWTGGSRPVVAQDVLYSWLRQADETEGETAWWAFEGLIAGLDTFHVELAAADEGERATIWKNALVNGVEGLQVMDEHRLHIRLQRRAPEFPFLMASPYAVVYPREAVERHGSKNFLNHPVGSGPYQLAEWRSGQAAQAVFRRTPGWRGWVGPEQSIEQPQIEELRFQHVAEGSTRTLMFRKGDIDRMPPLQDSFDALVDGDRPNAELREAGVTLQEQQIPGITFLGFNMRDPVVGVVPGDDEGNARRQLLRHAIARAFPYERWHRVLRNGVWARPATSIVPPGLPEAAGAPVCEARDTDLEEARRLLASAGYGAGKERPVLRFELAGASSADRDTGAIFQQALKDIGLDCEVVPNTWPAFNKKAHEGEAQVFMYQWTLDWPDAGNVLQLFYGRFAAPGLNLCNYESEEYDALFRQYRERETSADGSALVHRMLRLLHNDLPAIPIDHGRGFLLVQPWLKAQVHPFDTFACKYYRIEGR